jgi:hypothetical protein
MSMKSVLAKVKCRLRQRAGRSDAVRAEVPATATNFLQAGDGDELVFEKGSAFVAEKAAVPGPYVVLTVRRAQKPAPAEEARAAEPAASDEPAEPHVPFAEFVNQRRKERR